MSSLNRERATGAGSEQPTTEWRSMRKLGAFMKRKSSRSQPKETQLTWGASNSSSVPRKMTDFERVKRLEAELAQLRQSNKAKVDDLELKIASRDTVLRRRAFTLEDLEMQLSESKKESTILSARVEELEAQTSKYAERENVMTKEIKDRDEVLKIREDEIARVRHENRPRPLTGLIRTVVVGSTGFMFAVAATACNR